MHSLQIFPFRIFGQLLSPRYSSWLWPSGGRMTLSLGYLINDGREVVRSPEQRPEGLATDMIWAPCLGRPSLTAYEMVAYGIEKAMTLT